MTPTSATEPAAPRELPRTIGFWGGSAIMVGIMIGGGIFQTPTSIAKEMGSPLLILLLWVIGGLISLCGGLTYAELATMFPHSGGVYVFLREGFGRMTAFVFGWTYMLVTKPLGAGGIAIIFANHVNVLFGTSWDPRAITCVILILLTYVNTLGMRTGGGVAVALTALKIGALAGIVLLAVALSAGDTANFRAAPLDKPLLLALAPVMAAVLWTYDGWSDVGAIAGEVRDPQRRLPLIYFGGTALMTLIYVVVNAVYVWLVPLDQMRPADTVAPLVMKRLLGSLGEIVVTVMILVSTLGSTHGSIITGARVTFAQAADGLLFRWLAAIHPAYATPHLSLWCQLALSCLAVIWLKKFDELAGGFIFTMWIFYGLAGAAVFVLRRRRPDLHRPYRCWGYPVVPVLFILAAAGMTVLSIIDKPLTCLLWLAVLLAGAPTYFLWTRLSRPPVSA